MFRGRRDNQARPRSCSCFTRSRELESCSSKGWLWREQRCRHETKSLTQNFLEHVAFRTHRFTVMVSSARLDTKRRGTTLEHLSPTKLKNTTPGGKNSHSKHGETSAIRWPQDKTPRLQLVNRKQSIDSFRSRQEKNRHKKQYRDKPRRNKCADAHSTTKMLSTPRMEH
jgi:hypothetical protein